MYDDESYLCCDSLFGMYFVAALSFISYNYAESRPNLIIVNNNE